MCLKGNKLYHALNHPIKWVRLTGVIVAIDDYPGRKIYTLDDSSGMCIECAAIVAPDKKKGKEISLVPRHLDQLAAAQEKAEERERDRKDRAMKLAGYADVKGKAREDGKGEEKVEPSVATPLIPWGKVNVGTVVKVKGRIGSFRDVKQVEVVKIEVLGSTDMEVRCWDEVREFKTILGKQWVVSAAEQERCRRKWERDAKRARRGRDGGGDGKGERERLMKTERNGQQSRATRPPEKTISERSGQQMRATRPPEKTSSDKREYDARDEVNRKRRHMAPKESFEKNAARDSSLALRKAAAFGSYGAAKT